MRFNYQARTKTGKVQTGTIEASSKEAALELLQKSNLFITFLEGAEARPFLTKKIRIFSRTSQKDLVIFSRQLALMFKSQVPLIKALHVLAEQTKNADFKEKILTVSEQVEGGTSFSQALNRFPKVFSSFYVNMAKAGEASGTLSGSLNYLADHLERQYHLISKLKGAMIYPILIVVVVIGVLLMMMFFIIPNLARVLTETGQELPLMTKVVIGSSDFLRQWGWILLILLAGGMVAVFRYFQTSAGRRLRDRVVLKIPFIGPFLKMIFVSRFAENLSTLIAGGLPIVKSLSITGEIVGNHIYKNIISEVRDEVKKGQKISQVLSKYPKQFPPLLTQMVVVGERTGTLDQSLMNVVDFYQKEVERSIENLLSILEPLLVVVLGLIVAGLMASVLMPLYKMTTI